VLQQARELVMDQRVPALSVKPILDPSNGTDVKLAFAVNLLRNGS